MPRSVAIEKAAVIEQMPLEIASFHDCFNVAGLLLRCVYLTGIAQSANANF